MQSKRLSTAEEIARLLNTSRRMVYYYKGLGMPAKKFGPRSFRFDPEEVMRWSEEQNAKGSHESPRPV